MIGFVLSRVLGLLRDAIIAGVFGNGMAFDAYVAASRPPETIFLVVAGGALASAFIPTFSSAIEQGQREQAWRLTNVVITLVTLAMALICVVCIIFARQIVVLWVPEFSVEKQALTAQLMRIMLISPIIFGASGLLMGLLNAHQRFLLPALAPSLYNAGIIFGALALAPVMGVSGLAWGVVIGAALHLLVQLPGVAAIHLPFRPVLDVSNPGVREVARLMGPRVLGLAIVQINFWVNIGLASGMVEGSVGALQRAFMVLLLPQGLIAQSVATAVFPTFAAQAAREDTGALRQTLGAVLRAVLFLSIPATVGLILLRVPVIRLIFEHGQFTPLDTQATAWALLFYGLGLAAHALVEIVTRAFYALHDTRTPVLVGGGAMLLNILLSLLLIRVIGQPASLAQGPFAGLALANTLATTLEGLALLWLITPRVGGLEGRRMLNGTLRAGAASAVMGVLLWLGIPRFEGFGPVLSPLVAIAAGGAVFWGAAWLLRSEEAHLFSGIALRRLRRGRS